MTDSTTSISDTTGHDAHTPAAGGQGALEHLNPHELVLELNVRSEAGIDTDFVASVAEHGVLTPIAAVRAHDGVVRVRAGQRRVLAARQADLATVPVYVRPETGGSEQDRTVARLAEQITENDHRTNLTEAQRVNGIQQMLDTGLSVTKTAKTLSTPREVVKSVAAAGGSAAAMDGLNSGQLSLAEAAVLAEFDDDTDIQADLLAVAGSARFEHRVAQIREILESNRAYDQAAGGLREQGYTIIDEHPGWRDTSCLHISSLCTADGAEASTDTVEINPAHWVVHLTEDTACFDLTTDQRVDEHDIAWSGEPEDGKRHPNTVVERAVFEPEWFCIDIDAAGLMVCDILAKRAAHDTINSSASGAGDAVARAAAEAEQARRQRRQVIALNRLGAAATTVRREFITNKLLSRKTPPKGAARFVALCLTREPGLLGEYHGHTIAAEMLGVAGTAALDTQVSRLGANADGRAHVITLALILGALEGRTPKDAWRRTTNSTFGHRVGPVELLKFLSDNGYCLSAVEEIVTGTRTSDDVYTHAENNGPDQPNNTHPDT